MDEYVGPTRGRVLWFYLSFFLLILAPTIVLIIWGVQVLHLICSTVMV